MPFYCSVPYCLSKRLTKKLGNDSISFFSFPKDEGAIQRSWIEYCCRPRGWKPDKITRICSLHFNSSCIKPGKRIVLIKGSIPTVKNFNKQAVQLCNNIKENRKLNDNGSKENRVVGNIQNGTFIDSMSKFVTVEWEVIKFMSKLKSVKDIKRITMEHDYAIIEGKEKKSAVAGDSKESQDGEPSEDGEVTKDEEICDIMGLD